MKIKNLYLNIIIFSLFFSFVAKASSRYTSKDYFNWRDKFKQEKPNDFKAAKICEGLIGYEIDFESKIIDINKDAEIKADMDVNDIVSFPEISLSLKNKDQAENLRNGQTIKYEGIITKCEYNSFMNILMLSVSSGSLKLHY